jgi:hypothetical protein
MSAKPTLPHASNSSLSRRRSYLGIGNTRRSTSFPKPRAIPIPPSLIQSPYLNSPQSIFRRSSSAPRLPSEEDDEWLRDTVPLRGRVDRAGSGYPLLPRMAVVVNEVPFRGRSSQFRILSLSSVPPSSPLVGWQHNPPPTKSWLEQKQVKSRSESNISGMSKSYLGA